RGLALKPNVVLLPLIPATVRAKMPGDIDLEVRMCGILAILTDDKPVSPDLLSTGIARLGHRGPDSQGTWIASHAKVGLGSARLKIIDLVTGDQPIANEDEQLHIVVNGEFYGHERLQRELQQRGHRLRTQSDSEIALHLYEELGTACLKHLR